MTRLLPLHLIPVLVAAASPAAEIPVEQRPFAVTKSFSATVMPANGGIALRLDPQGWKDFEIETIADNGAAVAKGDTVLSFVTEEIDRKIEDLRRAAETAGLAVAQGELDAKLLAETGPAALDAARRAAETAKEENEYFTKTRRKSAEESAAQDLKRRQEMLENQREELRQLDKMYKADDVTEETEEIILTRQKDAVAAAEFALRMETLDHQRMLEIKLPREARNLANAERDAAVALEKAENETPRALATQKLALEGARTALKRAQADLAELEADRKLFTFKAPADGTLYHGSMEKGRWTIGDLAKNLIPHGHPAAFTPLATFVPADAGLALIAFLDDATARSLQAGQPGSATLAGREELEIPVKFAELANVPGADGNYRADFSVEWPKDAAPAAGATATVRVITYNQATAIAVPSKALQYGPAGWTVEIRLADGKNERRPVKRGRISGEDTEILEGLEAGQVVVVP